MLSTIDVRISLRKRLLEDRTWRYVKHDATDIRILFARVRAELAPQSSNVKPLKRSKP